MTEPLTPTRRAPHLAGLDLLASAVIVLDMDGRISYANAAAENLLESSLKALSRQKLTALFVNPEELAGICAQVEIECIVREVPAFRAAAFAVIEPGRAIRGGHDR